MATSLSKLLTKSKPHSHVCSTSHSLHRQFRLRHFSAVAALETQTSSPATPQGLPSAILSLPMLQVGIQRIESLFLLVSDKKRRSNWSRLLLFLPGVITFGLGSWQIDRRDEKVGLFFFLSSLESVKVSPLSSPWCFQLDWSLFQLEFFCIFFIRVLSIEELQTNTCGFFVMGESSEICVLSSVILLTLSCGHSDQTHTDLCISKCVVCPAMYISFKEWHSYRLQMLEPL